MGTSAIYILSEYVTSTEFTFSLPASNARQNVFVFGNVGSAFIYGVFIVNKNDGSVTWSGTPTTLNSKINTATWKVTVTPPTGATGHVVLMSQFTLES